MLSFCPNCCNLLLVEESIAGNIRFSCNTCPYIWKVNNRISTVTYPKLKVCYLFHHSMELKGLIFLGS